MPKLASTISVVVKSRTGIVYSGEVAAVSSINKIGPFDILPYHSNFVSMIAKKLTMHKTDGKKEELALDRGVLTVEDNKVEVYLGVGKVV